MAGRYIAVIAIILLLAAQAPGAAEQGRAAGQSAQKEGANEAKEPSDLEKGLMLLGTGLKAAEAMRPIRPEEEAAIGREVAARVFMRYGPPVADAALVRYVNLVGRTVAGYSGRAGTDYRFAVVESGEANAFAAPGGYIFITTGLLRKIGNEAQLAGVLAHEVAHVSGRHMVKTLERSRKVAGAVELSSVLLNEDAEALSRVTGIVTETLFVHGLDKEMEFEADRHGTAWAASAGYHPRGLMEFLAILKAGEGRERSVFFTTHPPIGARISKLNGDILPGLNPDGAKLEGRFAKTLGR